MHENLLKAVAAADAALQTFNAQPVEQEEKDFFADYVRTVQNRRGLVNFVVCAEDDAPDKLKACIEKYQQEKIAVVDDMAKLRTLKGEFVRLSASARDAAGEDEIKLVLKDLKDTIASFKRLLAALTRATSDFTKAMEQKKKKAIGQAEKQRKQDEQQKKKAEKDLQKQIKNAKGQPNDLPCLFMDAGIVTDLMQEIPIFDTLEAVKEQFKSGGILHAGGAFVLKNVESMNAGIDSVNGLRGFLQIFETQFPMSKQAKEKQRAQSLIKMDGLSKIKESMLSFCSSKCSAFPSAGDSVNVGLTEVNAYGFTSTMRFSGSEYLALASVRYSLKGEREIVSCSPRDLWEILQQRQSTPLRFTAERMVTTVLGETLWASRLDDAWVQELIKKGKADPKTKIFFKCVVPENSVLFLPAGVMVCERALNMKVGIGLRMTVADASDISKANLQMLRSIHNTYAEENCKLRARWEDALQSRDGQ